MSIYSLSNQNMNKISSLFEGWKDTLIWSCLQGYMGTAWTDSMDNSKSAQIIVADFCFFAGEINELLVKHKPQEYNSDFVIMVPQNEAWAEMIEKVYGKEAKKVTRYAIKKEVDIFDVQKLRKLTKEINQNYELKFIDRELYNVIKGNKWSSDLCSQFDSFRKYQERGIGVVALHNGEVVSGASSYTVYRDGIEIEIDTREDYRRKGLALACGARLILECLKRNLYPSWDAQNLESVALAKKLGYHFDKEYIAYEVYNYGKYETGKDS